MDLKDAYKKAFKEELEILVNDGKITLLKTLEEVAEDLVESVSNALTKGAAYSRTPLDDIPVTTLVSALKPKALEQVDKIDGEIGN